MLDFNKLTTLKEEINQYRPLSLQDVQRLEKAIKIEHIWSSNAIEGNSLTEYETESILSTGMTVAGISLKDHLEVVNLSEAYDYVKYLAQNLSILTSVDIRDINRLVTEKTLKKGQIAGAYRATSAWPSGHQDEPYTDPMDIGFKMDEFITWFNDNQHNYHPVDLAAQAHLKLVSIHPFADGNGRTSRLLMNFVLMNHGYPIINIQPDAEARDKYIDTLAEARRIGNPDKFVDLIGNYAEETLHKRLQILQLNEHNIEEAEKETNLFKRRPNSSKQHFLDLEQ